MGYLRAFLTGRSSPKVWREVLFPLLMAISILGLGLSVSKYPTTYDWMYTVISSLISPRDNPDGYRYLALSFVCSAIGLGAYGVFIKRHTAKLHPGFARLGLIALNVGALGLFLTGIERAFSFLSPSYPKTHELLAFVAFLGLNFAVIFLWSSTLSLRRTSKGRWGAVLATLPLAGAALSQAYLYWGTSRRGWVGPSWRAEGVPLYLSFAFWQWLVFAAIFIYLYLLLWILPLNSSVNSKVKENS